MGFTQSMIEDLRSELAGREFAMTRDEPEKWARDLPCFGPCDGTHYVHVVVDIPSFDAVIARALGNEGEWDEIPFDGSEDSVDKIMELIDSL